MLKALRSGFFADWPLVAVLEFVNPPANDHKGIVLVVTKGLNNFEALRKVVLLFAVRTVAREPLATGKDFPILKGRVGDEKLGGPLEPVGDAVLSRNQKIACVPSTHVL